ncbi:GGDEF domain [Vibrio astriarenae]|nr:GGDEF domain [Vibrio sp. C7]
MNFDVHEFIESLDFSFFEGYHLGFVSPEGEYFGSVMQGEFTFAKEFIDGRSDSIPEQFPALWQQMLANERGYWVHQGQFYNYISTQYYPGLQQLGAYILMVSPSNELKKKLSDNAIYVLLCSVILVISTFIFFVRLINRYETDTMERKLIHATINGVAGLVVVDKLGNVTKTNHKFSRLFGYTEEQATSMSLQSLGLDNDENKLLSVLSSARQNRYWVGELEGKNRFGAWLALSAKCEVFLDSVGDVDSYVITFTDVSKNKVLEGKLRKLGDTDPLTGCWNRRKFDQELDKQVNLANRYSDYEASLAIIDIDHFKTINDTLGHLEGDRILQRFAFLVRSACRDTDLVTRIGGEEFALIMPKTSPIQAMQALERVKQELNEQHDLKVKFSGGVSEIKHSAQQCYHNADSMLYRAKHSGRDQIIMWCESQNEPLVVEGRES